ncbi:hypothetical protein PHISP_03323 [Aspergillus sp. HF37]|nr:hypothetical protein PHISP_03323 [Aspergillus sp. HF37]
MVGYVDPHRNLTRGGIGNQEADEVDEELLKGGMKEQESDEAAVPSFLGDLPETRQELAEYYRFIQRLD